MSTLFSQTPKNRISLLLLTLCVFTVSTALWSMWGFFSNDVQLSTAYEYSAWIVGLLTTLIVFLAASLVKIKVLLRSHKILLLSNDDQRQREAALRESEAKYRIVAESASDAILTIDHESTILFVNP